MHASLRQQLRAQVDSRRLSTPAGFRLTNSGRLAATPVSGVSDKRPPPTLDGQTGVTVDVRLQGSSSRSSSRVSLPFRSDTAESNASTACNPIELPTLSPLAIPSPHLSRISSTRSLSDDDSFRTPSPIVFAHVPLPSPQRRSAQSGEAEPCDIRFDASDCEYGMAPPPHPTVSEESPTSPASPSRAPVSLEVGERMPRFHLPSRSPPSALRPSLELSPEYVRARLEEDRAMFAAYLDDLPTSPCSSYRRPISTSSAGRSPEIISTLPNITYTDRVLEGLPELDEAEKGSVLKSEGECTDERKVVSPEPPLKPERQFYRMWFLVLRRMQRNIKSNISQDRLLALPLVVHQAFIQLSGAWSSSSCALRFLSPSPPFRLCNADIVVRRAFFFILILATLSTLIDLIRDRPAPTAFGTQHIAILLVAWCPAIIFSSFGSSSFLINGVCRFSSISPQVIFQAFATNSYLGILAHSAHVVFTDHICLSFHLCLHHTVRTWHLLI